MKFARQAVCVGLELPLPLANQDLGLTGLRQQLAHAMVIADLHQLALEQVVKMRLVDLEISRLWQDVTDK